jgi:hypothetical protein
MRPLLGTREPRLSGEQQPGGYHSVCDAEFGLGLARLIGAVAAQRRQHNVPVGPESDKLIGGPKSPQLAVDDVVFKFARLHGCQGAKRRLTTSGASGERPSSGSGSTKTTCESGGLRAAISQQNT